MKKNKYFIILAVGMGLGAVILWLTMLGNIVQAAATNELHVCQNGCPYSSIQAAVDAAQPGDIVKVAQGTYNDIHHIASLDTDIFTATQVVAITKPIVIKGGYITTNWLTPDPVAQPSILDAGNQGRVFVILNTNSVTITGLQMTGGNATGLGGMGSSPYDAGGGVYIKESTVVFSENKIHNNQAHTGERAIAYGGGMFISDSNVALDRNVISANIGSANGHGYGGGIYMTSSHNATLTRNYIDGNQGTANSNGTGGGVMLSNCDNATLRGNMFINNIGSGGANYYGGGLYIEVSDYLVLNGNTFHGNTAGQAWSWGGGLYLRRSNYALLNQNIFEDNTASTFQGWGGGIYLEVTEDLTMNGNLVRRNDGTSNLSKDSWGGGIYIDRGGPYTLTNNAIIDNTGNTAGSGIYVNEASPKFIHTTINGNIGGDGSGIYITGTLNTVAMTNTLIANQILGLHVSSNSSAILNTSLWYDNDTNWGGSGDINHSQDHYSDPGLAADGYHLGFASAVIDLGLDAGMVTDIDGDTRPSRSGYDIGADEFMSRNYLPFLVHSQ